MIPNLLPPTDMTSHQLSTLGERVAGEFVDDMQGAAEQFESVFVSLLLKEMRQTTSEDGLFAGEASDSYGAMFDLYLGQHLAENGNFGIADQIGRYLNQVTPS